MAGRKPQANDAAEVSRLLAGLSHPMASEIQALRELILGVDEAIREGI